MTHEGLGMVLRLIQNGCTRAKIPWDRTVRRLKDVPQARNDRALRRCGIRKTRLET